MVGEFKDDQLQDHKHYIYVRNETGQASGYPSVHSAGNNTEPITWLTDGVDTSKRIGITTHGKQKGVKFIIKVL